MSEGKKKKTEEKKEETPEVVEEISEEKVEDEVVESEKKDSNANTNNNTNNETLTDKIRENPWVVATLVLGVIVVILLFTGSGFSSGAMTGATVGVVDADVAQERVLEFVNMQVDEPVSVVETTMKNGLYEIVISFQGRDIPLYVTADGENLVQGLTPLDQLMQAAQAADSGEGAAPTPTAVPKSDTPEVELFVMSICPFGTQAEKGILPVLIKLGDKIDFDLRFVSYAMHEKPEIDENTVQYCIQKEEPEKLYEYLECYLETNDPSAWEACRGTVGIDESKLQSCISAADSEFKIEELYADKSTWSGGRFPQYNTDKALNEQYGVRGSPTLIINGAQSNAGRSPASYLAGICAAFNNPPEECNVEMPAETPAPGFGWDALAASDTAAQCG